MLPLYTEYQFNNCKSREKLPLQCKQCNTTFYKQKNQIQIALHNKNIVTYDFCSLKCKGKFKTLTGTTFVNCKNCNVKFKKHINALSKSGNNFCSKSCAATYNNTHKTTGTRRSKLEQ